MEASTIDPFPLWISIGRKEKQVYVTNSHTKVPRIDFESHLYCPFSWGIYMNIVEKTWSIGVFGSCWMRVRNHKKTIITNNLIYK